MRLQTIARTAAGAGLGVVARVLAVSAKGTERIAALVRPDSARTDRDGEAARTPTGEQAAVPARTGGRARRGGGGPGPGVSRVGAVRQPPTEPVPEVPDHARTSETHTEELAARPANEVIAAIPGLSTDELGRLYEHELATKRRKTVLEAIERSAAPQAATAGRPESRG